MTLAEWMAQYGLNQIRAAAKLGISNNFLCQIVRRQRKPSPDLAARISAATGGLVTVQDLLYPDGLPEGAVLGTQGQDEDEAGGDEGDPKGGDEGAGTAAYPEGEEAIGGKGGGGDEGRDGRCDTGDPGDHYGDDGDAGEPGADEIDDGDGHKTAATGRE